MKPSGLDAAWREFELRWPFVLAVVLTVCIFLITGAPQ